MNLDHYLLIAAKVGAIGVLFALGALGFCLGTYKTFLTFSANYRCWALMIAMIGRKQRRKLARSFFREIYDENPEEIRELWENIIKHPNYR